MTNGCFLCVCRCACFSGPACPGSLNDPCQPYRSLPPIPTEFTLYYKGVYTECSPAGCNDSYFSGREVQTLAEHKKRDDVFGRSSTFVLPDNGSGFNQVRSYLTSVYVCQRYAQGPRCLVPTAKVCVRAKWPIRPELIPISVA